ncbi:MAG: hypothetical protein KME43_25795 [Myxacorys chilensis ATA2-1-KO14]|jgi:hypothetical protein|nr:hypothetical protein [Myxacorys chilensis ATA2-1-KO14]
MATQHFPSFEGVREWTDKFLALFPHRYDYIWAEHPHAGAKVDWQTETRHPLNDRLIQQGAYLYGIRFGAETQYCLLDIDAGSLYHPNRDPFALGRITGALEPLGLVESLICTSSHSGGLHLYFPFSKAQSSWQLAIAVATMLENSGFKLVPGQLEVFPNPKPYIADGTPSLFNAHRLPLQTGSYLLNDEFQPIWSTQQTFVDRWHFAQSRNDLDTKTLKQILKQAKRQLFRVSGKAEKFINDLNAEIELGWTGYGQTNRLLGRITMRSYIFHHILSGGQPLAGGALIKEIVETAKALPGYQEWCRHQHEIEQRAEEWARCIENSHYFHYGDQNGKFKAKSQDSALDKAVEQSPSWNQQQSASARDRIRSAIADLLEKGILPTQATQRFKVLLQYRIGGGSLYRHRDLWHPQFLMADSLSYIEELAPESSPQDSTSLLPNDGGNTSPSHDSGRSTGEDSASIGGNSLIHRNSDSSTVNASAESFQILFDVQGQREACEEAVQLATKHQHRIQSNSPSQVQIERMQRFLNSGDPILIAEATAWEQVNPGFLRVNEPRLSPPQNSQRESQFDRLEIWAAIQIQMVQLNWSVEQVNLALWRHFTQSCLAMLSDLEVWHLFFKGNG